MKRSEAVETLQQFENRIRMEQRLPNETADQYIERQIRQARQDRQAIIDERHDEIRRKLHRLAYAPWWKRWWYVLDDWIDNLPL